MIHIHDLPLVKVGLRLKKKYHLKLVADMHENWPALLQISKHIKTISGRIVSPLCMWRKYEKNVLIKADKVIVVIDEAKTRLNKLGVDNNKIHIVSNTINYKELDLKTPLTVHKETILYYAGGINRHRGLQHVIQAMHKTNNPLLKFWIIGEGSYKHELMKLIKDLGLNHQIEFFGFLPFQQMMDKLMSADFALIPHLKTQHTDSTIPNKLFQYMYAGKPVIASDCIPIRRILEETNSGIVYPSEDTDFLADIFLKLTELDVHDMAMNGKKAVIEKYNWENDSNNLVKMYTEISHEKFSADN